MNFFKIPIQFRKYRNYKAILLLVFFWCNINPCFAQLKPDIIYENSSAADQDDMCIWIHPKKLDKSAVISSDKIANFLFVYDLNGNCKDSVRLEQPGNIDVRYAFWLDEKEVDIISVNDRANGLIAIFTINSKNYQLTRIDDGKIETGENYGFCLYKSPLSGKCYAFSVDKSGKVKQFELQTNSDLKVTGRLVRILQLESQCEGMVCDDETAKLYVGEEDSGVYKFGAEPDSGTNGEKIIWEGKDGLAADIEGLAIYYKTGGNGYIIVSSQGNASYHLYERAKPHQFVGNFALEGVTNTDGLDVANLSLNKTFKQGMFICHDGAGPGPYMQKAIDFGKICSSILSCKSDTKYWNPRKKHDFLPENSVVKMDKSQQANCNKKIEYQPPIWPEETGGNIIQAKATVLDWDKIKFEWTGTEGVDYMFYFKGNGHTKEWKYYFKGANYPKEKEYNYTIVYGLMPGEKYKMYVTYRWPKEKRMENRSNYVEFTMPHKIGLSAVPVLSKPIALSHKRVKLQWEKKPNAGCTYFLERKDNEGEHFQIIAKIDKDSAVFINYGLIPNTTYTYSICSVAPEGVSYSNEESVKTFPFNGNKTE